MLTESVFKPERLILQYQKPIDTPRWSVKKFIAKKFRVWEGYYLTVVWVWLVGFITEVLKKFQGLPQITAFLNTPKGRIAIPKAYRQGSS